MKKPILILLVLAASSLADLQMPRGITEDLGDFVNRTIYGIINGLSGEPLNILPSGLNISSTSADVNGSFQLSNLNFTGIKNLQVPYLKVAIISYGIIPIPVGLDVTAQFSLPLEISVDDYDLDIVLFDLLPLYGKGKTTIEISPLINGSVKIDILRRNITDLRIQTELLEALFGIEGFMYDADFSKQINKFLKSFVMSCINDNMESISDTISSILKDLINSILAEGNSTSTYLLENALRNAGNYDEDLGLSISDTISTILEDIINSILARGNSTSMYLLEDALRNAGNYA